MRPVLADGAEVTVSCAEGDTGHVYAGLLDIEVVEAVLERMPPSPTKIMMNVGNPELAFAFQRLPNEGVGLARLEFIINRNVGIHPLALIEYDRQPESLKRDIDRRIAAYPGPPSTTSRRSPRAWRRSRPRSGRRRSSSGSRTSRATSTTISWGGPLRAARGEPDVLGFRGASRYLAKEFYECGAECRDEACATTWG